MALLHMYDCLTITKSDTRFPVRVSDSKSLFVKAHATHSGNINGNYRFYRPDSMQKATHTWLPFGAPKRPVIINHKEDSEVLGRVVEAKYIDESYKWATDFPTIKDSLFYKTDGKKVGLFESVDWIVDNLAGQKGYTGLGYIELGLNITNPEAIEKVLRDEYLTVSVGFTTDSVICSVCHQDWAVDDRCDHNPGEIVDKKQVFLICGPKAYDEVSFVTFPADPFASILSKEALKDRLTRISYVGLPLNKRKAEVTFSDSLFTYDITHAEENMDNLDKLIAERKFDEILAEIKSDLLTLDTANQIKAGLTNWAPTTDEDKTRKRSLQSTLNAKIRNRNLDNKVVEEDNVEVLAAIASGEACQSVTFNDIAEVDRDYFNDAEGIYGEMEVIIDKTNSDAKLTLEQKAALSDSDFCGPNKTFPVLNLDMAAAAITVVEESKLTDDTKLKLINAIKAKKETLKAKEVEKPADAVASPITISDKIKSRASEKMLDSGKEVLGIFTSLDKAYDSSEEGLQADMRCMLSAMQEDWYADTRMAYLMGVLETHDFVVLPKPDMQEKEDAVNSLTEKVSSLTDTVTNQKKITNTLLDTYKKSLATQIVVYKILNGQEGFVDLDLTARKEKVETLAKRHVEYLKDTVNDILLEVKFEEVKLENTVSEPGVQVSDSAHVDESKTTTITAATDTKHGVDKIPQYLTASERKKAQLQAAYDSANKKR